MANYLLAYHGGGPPSTPEEGEAVMAAWMKWLTDLGDAIVDGGNPISQAKTIAPNGSVAHDGGANPVTGYSVIKADSLEAASRSRRAARTCRPAAASKSPRRTTSVRKRRV